MIRIHIQAVIFAAIAIVMLGNLPAGLVMIGVFVSGFIFGRQRHA